MEGAVPRKPRLTPLLTLRLAINLHVEVHLRRYKVKDASNAVCKLVQAQINMQDR